MASSTHTQTPTFAGFFGLLGLVSVFGGYLLLPWFEQTPREKQRRHFGGPMFFSLFGHICLIATPTLSVALSLVFDMICQERSTAWGTLPRHRDPVDGGTRASFRGDRHPESLVSQVFQFGVDITGGCVVVNSQGSLVYCFVVSSLVFGCCCSVVTLLLP